VRPIQTAGIIAVGSELLTPTRVDTDSLYITRRLAELGVAVRFKLVVGDVHEDLRRAVKQALARVDLVILTGGLGPTDDDLTREAVSDALRRPLHEDPASVEALEARFARRGLTMPAINRRQAMVLDGADVIPNAFGSAPGQWLEHGGRVVLLLPGPPRELEPMFDAVARQRLAARAAGTRRFTRVVRVAGNTESHAEERAKPLYEHWRREHRQLEVTTLAVPGSIDFHVTAVAASAAEGAAVLAHAVEELRSVFGADAFSDDDESMERVVAGLLREHGSTIGVAESCTGGLLASRLTDVPGSSAYLERGVVAYSNAAKTELLGVPAELIAEHGAVSEPVAAEMARGVKRLARTTIGVGITGIAGPDGGTPAKPVGTVAIAIEGPWGTRVRTRVFPGARDQVKFSATQAALDDLRRALIELRPGMKNEE
jgi:nicotinamide-nucleotide amidase